MSWSQFSDAPAENPEDARAHLLPVPLEATVSYAGGTGKGPAAILEASYQLENYDREFRGEPGLDYGIFTHPSMELPGSVEEALPLIEKRVAELFTPHRFLGVLGGEHSITEAVVDGVVAKVQEPITVVQLDAHCDLRDSYEGSPHSHACVARRMLERDGVEEILQFGIRSLCKEEAEVLNASDKVTAWFVEEMTEERHLSFLRSRLEGRKVFLTLDVDCFDPALVPSTGTPEPDGLTFRQADHIVKAITEVADLVAFDCVELAPIPGFHAADFLVAKFLYRLMNHRLARP